MPPLNAVEASYYGDVSSEFSVSSRSSLNSTKSALKKKSSSRRRSRSSMISQPPKSVTFNKSVKVRPVLHCKDYTKAELTASFYSQYEISAIRTAMKFAAKALEKQQQQQAGAAIKERHNVVTDDNDHFCIRGLEFRTQSGHQQRSNNKKESRRIVLVEQRRQKQSGKSDPSYISYLYKESTRISLLMAQEIAMEDEAFVYRNNSVR